MPPLFILQVHVYKAVTLTWIYLIAIANKHFKMKTKMACISSVYKIKGVFVLDSYVHVLGIFASKQRQGFKLSSAAQVWIKYIF